MLRSTAPFVPACGSDPFTTTVQLVSAIGTVRLRVLILAAITAFGLAARAGQLGATGFAEDEMAKVRAIAAYGHADYSANAEHPMLMKLVMTASLAAADRWNATAVRHGWSTIAPEAALRLPNAVAGAATAPLIYVLAARLFDPWTGLAAAALWATDVNATALNRIGKEDTLLVFFFLLAAWLYEVGKGVGRTNPAGAQRWFIASGAAWGLMLASKYMPYFFGLHVLFFRAAEPHPGRNRPDKIPFFTAMAVAFVMANPVILLPDTWAYFLQYGAEHLMPHTGYVFAGHLYMNKTSATPFGVPPWYYLTYLLLKVPLPVLAAIVAGVVLSVRHRGERGFVFLRIFIWFVLVPYSFAAAKFVRYLLPIVAVLDIAAAVGLVSACRLACRLALPTPARIAAAAGVILVIIGAGVRAQAASAPFYSLHENLAGRAVAGETPFFPDCEIYDAGIREAIAHISAEAGPGAVIVSEVPRVVAHYAAADRRPDLRSRALSRQGLPPGARETWVIVQPGKIYFENADTIATLRQMQRPVDVVRVGGVEAVEVYRIGHGAPLSAAANIRGGGTR